MSYEKTNKLSCKSGNDIEWPKGKTVIITSNTDFVDRTRR